MSGMPLPGDVFRHLNGYKYEVIAIARDDYSGQDLVIHKGLHDGRIWSRPLVNFNGSKNGAYRFVADQA